MEQPQLQITVPQMQILSVLLAKHLPHIQVWAFGSRIKGKARDSSDLDLVVFTDAADTHRLSLLREALEESLLPFAVDTLVWNDISPEFQKHIASNFIELQKAGPVKANS